MKGGYFAIQDYLQRLEQLSWRLYWDSFDYSVTHYPEGVVTISFYTLMPFTVQPVVQQGGAH